MRVWSRVSVSEQEDQGAAHNTYVVTLIVGSAVYLPKVAEPPKSIGST